jgi:16S rRNA (adenine1518-N6/adenine1519-N6)-dimethyltransferase
MPSLAVETRRILRAHGLHPKKTLGQTFLIDREALQSVVRAAEVRSGDVVLEIGPGVGTLTTELADQGAEVVAVELDERLADVLAERTAHGRHVRVVRGNALHLDLAPLLPAGEPFKLVANIPYYITAPILRHFLEGPQRPALIVLMVQKEVAERLAAQPGDMSLLGVMAQFYARVEIVRVVPASSFLPVPQVDSAIVRLRRETEAVAQRARARPGAHPGHTDRRGAGAGGDRPHAPRRDAEPGGVGAVVSSYQPSAVNRWLRAEG